MGTEPAREAMILQHLRNQGIGRQHRSDPDLNQLQESGHMYGLGKWGHEGWLMSTWHPGDPNGSYVISHLGRDDLKVPERAADQFRRPAFVKAIGEQWQRAVAAGDPHGDQGLHYQGKWHEATHHFRDYGDG